MRVIAGQFRSRKLLAPPGRATRPTSDRLRETLFNVLGERVVARRFADLYAGSGAVGIEALSRGAEHCLFVERAPPAVIAIRKNLEQLGLSEQATVEVSPVVRALADAIRREQRFDVIFLDPPYEAAAEYALALARLGEAPSALLHQGAVVAVEHARRLPPAEGYGGLRRQRLLEQGDAALSFYGIEE